MDAYYRFTIVEETFQGNDVAESRFERLKDNDPALNSKRHPETILRDGFCTKNRVLYAMTDVSKFEIEELPAIVTSLRSHIGGTTEGEQDADEQANATLE